MSRKISAKSNEELDTNTIIEIHKQIHNPRTVNLILDKLLFKDSTSHQGDYSKSNSPEQTDDLTNR